MAAVVPVMKDEACDDRNSTADATSSGRALRPMGCFVAVEASIAARLMPCAFASVSAHLYALNRHCTCQPIITHIYRLQRPLSVHKHNFLCTAPS